MGEQMLYKIAFIFPEISLVSVAIIMQILAAFYKERSSLITSVTVFVIIIVIAALLYFTEFAIHYNIYVSVYSFEVNPVVCFIKAGVLGLALMSIIIYHDLCKIEHKQPKMEFVTLVLLSTLGIFVAISSGDFMLLFCGLELQALSGYALASFSTNNVKSSEAGLKYFVLGALMSCVMLLGISFLYGYSGSINFNVIWKTFGQQDTVAAMTAMVTGMVLVISAILFKLSAAPLHIWTPDVYEGAPISTVSYFAVAQKFGILIILLGPLGVALSEIEPIAKVLFKYVSIISMIVGALGAVMQNSLKRLMAYSSILNVGYVLIGVFLYSPYGHYAAITYMFIYVVTSIGFFACLVALFGKDSDEATFDSLRGVAATRKTLAAVIAILMFSFVGIPPFAGFFGKYYLFYNAIKQGELVIAIVGIVTSVIAAFYYLKVIKYMYFEEAQEEVRIIKTRTGLKLISGFSAMFVMLFFSFTPLLFYIVTKLYNL